MKITETLKRYRRLFMRVKRLYPSKRELGACGKNTILENPVYIEHPSTVFADENTRIRRNVTIINSPTEKIFIKKYSVIAPGVTIITNSHRSTVGIPHFLLGVSHINDKSADVVIEEDVWIGANATITAGVTIGRGAIVGACSLVTKDVPPYTLVAGSPAKVVKKFSAEDVMRHEAILYPVNERLTKKHLYDLLELKYKDLQVYGCNTPLTDDDKNRLAFAKKHLSFIPYDEH